MSTIDEIREQSKTVWAVSAAPRTGGRAAEDSFSALLKNMRAGKPAGSGEEKDTQTTTVTQVLSDGSVLVTVYEGNRIVSETKTRSANPEQTPAVLSTRTETSGMAQMAQAASTLGESALLNLLQRP
ncbi:hypothetical protein [Selenomonas bovis]|jgi:hypothetical protein|uniref:hypothetical protein n=1 Tax=Selenomonas bovis TaxID=416586 RepID=UPI0003746385|nr:hypothetical protein [Selenomonas bovis]MBQ1622464.1 hypothetical protein [Selenomonas sp.]MCI6172085.1 hypothetical protein [Selenomonas bovis]MCI7057050.1 hypothetical protein [Selenomonas bovis]